MTPEADDGGKFSRTVGKAPTSSFVAYQLRSKLSARAPLRLAFGEIEGVYRVGAEEVGDRGAAGLFGVGI